MVDGLHPAIIPWEDWERVQEIRKGRHIPSVNHGQVANPMAGLIRCGNCGRNMQRVGAATKGGPRLHCMEKACIASAKFGLVEQRLLENLERMRDELEIEAQKSSGPDISSLLVEKRTIEAKLRKTASRVDVLHDLLEDGTYDRETFKTRLSKAQAETEALNAQQADVERRIEEAKRRDTTLVLAQLTSVLQLYPTLDNEGKNRLLKSVIDYVIYRKPQKTRPMAFTLEIKLKNI